MAKGTERTFFQLLKSARHSFASDEVYRLFQRVDRSRVEGLASQLAEYITDNLPAAFEKRTGLAHYRTNPYVLITSANVMNLSDPRFLENFFLTASYTWLWRPLLENGSSLSL